MHEHENHVNDVQTRWTDESWWIMSQMSCAKQSPKSITQINCTRWDDIMSKNGKSLMTLIDVPEQLRCLWRKLRLLI